MAMRKAKTTPIVPDRVQSCDSCRHRMAREDFHECRRYPPTIVLDMSSGGHYSAYPMVGLAEYCGEWAPKLNS
jgi:hypothetical protein